MKEGRKTEGPLCLCQAAGEDGLQHNAADQSDESKSLSDTDEQFRAIEVLRSPSGGVLRAQPGSECRTGKPRGEQQARIDFAQEQERGDEGNRKERNSAPDNRGTDLISLEAANGQRLWNKDDGCTEGEAEPKEQAAKQYGIPLQQIRQRHERIRSA